MSTFMINFHESKCKMNILNTMCIGLSAVCMYVFLKQICHLKGKCPQASKFTGVNIVCPEFAVKLVSISAAVFI